jgi:hypothetical protein
MFEASGLVKKMQKSYFFVSRKQNLFRPSVIIGVAMNKLVKWFEMQGKNVSLPPTPYLSYWSGSLTGIRPIAGSVTLITLPHPVARLLTAFNASVTDFIMHDFQRLTDFNGL